MREKVGLKVVKALKRRDVGVTHAAIDMLCALMQVIILSPFPTLMFLTFSARRPSLYVRICVCDGRF